VLTSLCSHDNRVVGVVCDVCVAVIYDDWEVPSDALIAVL